MNGRRVIMGALVAVAATTLVAGATASSSSVSAGGAYKQVGAWGKAGAANGQFNNAFGLATDKAGNLYVADTDNNRVQVFSTSGAFLRKWGVAGDGNGQFQGAQDVAIDGQGGAWVADRANERIQAFGSGGGFQQAITSGSQPSGLGVDDQGNLFVGEFTRVARYDKASDYALAKAWGGLETTGDVEVSPDGSVYVADNGALRVIRYDLNGKRLGVIGGGLSAPIGIGVDPDCNVWMSNIAQRRIEKRSPSGRLLATAASEDLIAIDIAAGPRGDVYASNNSNRSIVRFAADRAKPATANIPGSIKVSGGKAKIGYTLSGVACPAEVGATATVTGAGISGKAGGLKLKAGAKNTITMTFSKAASGKATFKIVLKTNGRPTTETRSVTVAVK
jgi:DNA-binding beta-propeller fold protein YncE